MDVRGLIYFVAVAEERNVTRAAERLHLAQPSLSQQLRQLERELGAELFDRSQRPLRLTPGGERLLEHAYAVLARLDEARTAVRRAASGEIGELRLGYAYGGLYEDVLRLVCGFAVRRPRAGVVLRQLPAADQVRAVREGEVDVALSRVVESIRGDDLVVHVLREERLIALLPADHRLAAGAAGVRLSDLADEPFLLASRHFEPLVFDRYLAACADAGFSPRLERDIGDAQSQALEVAAGHGVALSGEGLAQRFPGIAYLPIQPDTVVTEIAALWPRRLRNPLVYAAINELRSWSTTNR